MIPLKPAANTLKLKQQSITVIFTIGTIFGQQRIQNTIKGNKGQHENSIGY